MEGIWAVVRVKESDGDRLRTVRCSLRLIEALTANEAWGRIWAGLLTSGITPATDGDRLRWAQPNDNGSETHFDIALLPSSPAGQCEGAKNPTEN